MVNNGYGVGIFFRNIKSLGKEFICLGRVLIYWSNQFGKDSILKKYPDQPECRIDFTLGLLIFPNISFSNSLYRIVLSRCGIINTTAPASNLKTDNLLISSSLSSNPLNALGIGIPV
jgi:hypothetical protein